MLRGGGLTSGTCKLSGARSLSDNVKSGAAAPDQQRTAIAEILWHSRRNVLTRNSCHQAFGVTFMGVEVRVMENGRMVLPAAIRKRLGLEKGGTVIVEVGDEEVTLRSVEQVLDKVKATFAKYADLPGTSVDDFLANRRAESGE